MTRELDAEVAEKVMGWKRPTRGSVTWYRSDGTGTSDAPEYSSSIGLAFQVVEKMRERGFRLNLGENDKSKWYALWYCNGWPFGWSKGNTPSEAICLSALEAIPAAAAALASLTTHKEQGHAGRIGEEK